MNIISFIPLTLVLLFISSYIYREIKESKRKKEDDISWNAASQSWELYKNIMSVNISGIKYIRFIPKNSPTFELYAENIKRLIVYIVSDLWKKDFEPNEITSYFTYLESHILSRYPENRKKEIVWQITNFVQEGGEVVFVRSTIIAIASILILWGFATCWWNFILMIIIPKLGSDVTASAWINFWFIELLLVFIYAIIKEIRLSYKWYKITGNIKNNIETQQIENSPTKTTDLMSSLGQIDITNISGITFLPKVWKWFQVKTPNIKRLAIYISSKLWKTTFEAEELRNIYNHVVKNLQSNLSKTDYNIVQGKINEFVQSGGEVKIEKV